MSVKSTSSTLGDKSLCKQGFENLISKFIDVLGVDFHIQFVERKQLEKKALLKGEIQFNLHLDAIFFIFNWNIFH